MNSGNSAREQQGGFHCGKALNCTLAAMQSPGPRGSSGLCIWGSTQHCGTVQESEEQTTHHKRTKMQRPWPWQTAGTLLCSASCSWKAGCGPPTLQEWAWVTHSVVALDKATAPGSATSTDFEVTNKLERVGACLTHPASVPAEIFSA